MNKKASKIHVQTIQKNQQILNDKISQNICPKCGNELIEKLGKNGKFVSCSKYPQCRYAS
jgi:DNA topoisomerase-1